MLVLKDDHKQHLTVLISQPVGVLTEFCKLAIEFLHKGPNRKVYQTAALKLECTPDVIRNAVEGLTFLLVESCKHDLSELDFRDSVLTLGFSEDQHETLGAFYRSKREEIRDTLALFTMDVPRFKSIDWRFEVQVASRAMPQQITPLVTFRLGLDEGGVDRDVVLQTDPVNLKHMLEVLEGALSEGTAQHTRHVQQSFK